MYEGKKKPSDILVACSANSTVVYFPSDQDFLRLRSISAHAHQQYYSINWIPDGKSVPPTQPRSRVQQHLAGVGVEQMALWLQQHVVIRRISCVLGIPHCQPRPLIQPREAAPKTRGSLYPSNQPPSHTSFTRWEPLLFYGPVSSRDFVCSVYDGGESRSSRCRHSLALLYQACLWTIWEMADGRIMGGSSSASFSSCTVHMNYQ